MKKIKYLLMILITIFMFTTNVFAASGSLSVNKSSVYVGDSFTVTANISSSAAWNVHVTASGPVSGCSINQADATADAMDTNKSFSATCTATGEGTITITLSGDVTSASDGNAVGISGSKTVSVTTKPAPATNNNNNSGGNNNNQNNNGNQNNNQNNNKSSNNKIKELSIDGFELAKVDNNNYTLNVSNDVTSVNVKASAEDGKATVSGAGNHELKVGENVIEVVVTAENGSKNTIKIKVTRKDGYYLEDLDTVLNDDKIEDINIIVDKNTKITSSDIEKIKNSKKTVKFNYYDENKKLLYSLIVDGSKVKDTNEFMANVSYESSNRDIIAKLSNYADNMYVSIDQNTIKGAKIRLFVGDKFSNDSIVNVYGYSNNKLKLVNKKLKVVDGYIEFDANGSSDYIVTMSNINNKSFNIVPILLIIILILVIIIVLLLIKIKFIKREGK